MGECTMNLNKTYFLIMVIVLILAISAVSANDNTNITSKEDTTNPDINVESDILSIEDFQNEDKMNQDRGVDSNSLLINDSVSDKLASEDDSRIIYVGRNTTENGNGSYENPFSTLSQVSTNTSGENKIIVNIFNGTYELGSVLKFNTSNLVIQGINGKVIIKSTAASTSKAIGLISSSGNFEMNNIIFDASSHPDVNEFIGPFFYPFSGNANQGTFNNCSFIGFKNNRITGAQEYTVNYINCLFEGFNGYLFAGELKNNKKFVYFKNCVFLNKDVNSLALTSYTNKDITFDGAWFGQNSIPEYVFAGYQVTGGGATASGVHIAKITRYAIFSVYENYLGNNQYEIIGKLKWNDTTSEGIEGFNPMTVSLSSNTGEIQDNAILVNGTFKAIYNSISPSHSVTAQLGYEKIVLNFNTINMQLNSPSIYYGDDENITINFDQQVNGIVNIVVNNKTYNATINGANSFTYKIEDILTEGKYGVDVFLDDLTNHVHAYGTTQLVVSKVTDYTFDSIVPSSVNVGYNTTIIVELPEDVTGNVTIIVGDNNFTKNASKSTEIIINGLVEGDNTINVIYSGSNKYVPQSKVEVITAEKVELKLDDTTLNVNTPAGTNVPTITLNLPKDATGNLTVNINGKNYNKTLVNGSATLKADGLGPGNYNAVITYSGDYKYYPITANATVSISKPVLTAKDFTMLYTSGQKYSVLVTLDGKAVADKIITFTIDGVKTTAKTDKNGYASVKIDLPPKTKPYTVKATYLGVTKINKVTVKSIVTAKNIKVKKSAKKITIKVVLKKINGKYLKGKQIALKFNGKNYKVKTNKKGVATFIIKKNVLKKLKIGKKYAYKATYGKDTVSKKITIKK